MGRMGFDWKIRARFLAGGRDVTQNAREKAC